MVVLLAPEHNGVAAVFIGNTQLDELPHGSQRERMYVFVLEQRVTRLHQKAVAVGYVVAQLTVRGAAGLRGIAQLHLQVSDFGGS